MYTQLALTNLLPAPFDWVNIPGGEVRLDHVGGYITQPTHVEVAPFAMARYPITCAQFAIFAGAADGYCNPAWWDYSAVARNWRLGNTQPAQVSFGGADYPRTHITWYEAVAFCHWLSANTGMHVRLPTEAEWQRAAQGDDNRPYPWGQHWEPDHCTHNLAHDQIGPSAVSTHEGRGESPFGVVDMLGNVWEWCATNWDTGMTETTSEDVRVVRGGSWFDDVMSCFRTTYRSSWMPGLTSDLRGFRVVLSIPAVAL